MKNQTVYIIVGVVVVLVGIVGVFSSGMFFKSNDSSNTSSSSVSTASSISSVSLSNSSVSSSNNTSFDTVSLAKFNGLNGQKCYVAVSGKVYDVTNSRLWKNGVHNPAGAGITCGKDLTEEIKKAPHSMDKAAQEGFQLVGDFK